MITLSAHLLAYLATLLLASSLLLLSFLFPSFNQWLSKLAVVGAANGNEYVVMLIISIICYLIFMVVFSGVGKENRNIERLTRLTLIATIAFACFVAVTTLLNFIFA